MQSRHVSVVIPTSPERVYEFAADAANLPRWAAGLASGRVTHDGEGNVSSGRTA